MSKIARYVILACPYCAQKHFRAEYVSASDPAFLYALDPLSRLRVGADGYSPRRLASLQFDTRFAD